MLKTPSKSSERPLFVQPVPFVSFGEAQFWGALPVAGEAIRSPQTLSAPERIAIESDWVLQLLSSFLGGEGHVEGRLQVFQPS